MGRFKIFQRKKEKDGCAVETGSQPAGLHAQISTTSQGAHPPVAELEKRVEKLGDRVYCAVGYALSNVTMVAVEGGKVIVDTTESLEAAREIKAEFDRLVPGPVKGIFYTHSHPESQYRIPYITLYVILNINLSRFLYRIPTPSFA